MRTPLLFSVCGLCGLGVLATSPAFAADTGTKEPGTKPAASSGWGVVEEDWYFPLRYEPGRSLYNARRHFRHAEEKAAANEIDKAASWLQYAAEHGYPETHKSLSEAARALQLLAADLRSGKTAAAGSVDQLIAKAEHALATWHYFKAANSLAQDELTWAAADLQAASSYLRNAAASVHYEFGSDKIVLFDSLDKEGNLVLEGSVAFPHSELEQHLQSVHDELDKLAEVLKQDGSSQTEH
jgi:TPR repeat protein